MRTFWKLFSAGLLTAVVTPSHAGMPVISNLSDLVVDEQDPLTLIDTDISVAGGSAYTDGYIEFSIAGATAEDTLSLTSDSDVNANGAISLDGTDLYLGNGAGRDRIGSIDATSNGQAGAALKILFSSPLENSSFETGTTAGWTTFATEYPDSASLDGDSINWVENGGSSGTGTIKVGGSSGMTYTISVDTANVSSGTYSLRLRSQGNITCPTPGAGQNPDGYCSIHGPYVESSPFEALNGDQIYTDWSAQNGGDWYEVFGFLIGDGADNTFGTGDDTETLLFSQRGDTKAFSVSSANITADDTYKFRFIAGTYDASGYLGVGASLYVDNVRIVSGTAVSDTVVLDIARRVAFANSSDSPPAGARTLTVTAKAQDGNTGTATADLTVNPINDEPSLTSSNPGASSVNEGFLFSYDADASDPDLVDTLTFSVTTTASFLSINP